MYENWELSLTNEAWEALEEAELMVMEDEKIIQDHLSTKLIRTQRIRTKKEHKASDRVKNRSYQHKADNFKRVHKKKGYDLKQKGLTRRDHITVPPNALGWDKIGMETMEDKLHGIKVGYIFAVT